MDRRSRAIAGEPVRVTRNGRRYYSKAHKEAVVAKCLAPGASLAAVALSNGFNANLVRKWVRQRQACGALVKPGTKLMPVTLSAEEAGLPIQRLLAPRSVKQAQARNRGLMQMRIGLVTLTLRGVVDREQLSLVLEALLRAR